MFLFFILGGITNVFVNLKQVVTGTLTVALGLLAAVSARADSLENVFVEGVDLDLDLVAGHLDAVIKAFNRVSEVVDNHVHE